MIKATFDKHRSIFIPLIMARHPTLKLSTKAVIALANTGADVFELGVPFSDPITDGPVNQRNAGVAIENRMNLTKVLTQVHVIRSLGCKTSMILFTYINSTFYCKKFCKQSKANGVDGMLIVDLPPEEGEDFYVMLKEAGVAIVLLGFRRPDSARLFIYIKLQSSFIYITGIQQDLSNTLAQELNDLRNSLPHTKRAVGFGISSTEQAKYVSQITDRVTISEFEEKAREFSDIIHGDKL